MTRRRLEVADVVRSHGESFLDSRRGRVPGPDRRVLSAISTCRTAACGGHIDRCDRCDHQQIAYNSCRNRHCPKCQATARRRWLADRQRDLLPVEYFHVVFTIPHRLAPIALQNRKAVYAILFKTSADAMRELAADPKYLGAEIGFVSVLHTWGETLMLHPHVHCVVPGGGIAPDGSRWVSCRGGFFLPVKVLGRLFRGKFLAALRGAHDEGRLRLRGELAHLNDPREFKRWLSPLYDGDWIVYAKPPFDGPAHVLKYLSRYTHRVAISNQRLLALTDGRVRFRWKDYRHGRRRRVMTLTAHEFLRRFLLHVLPPGFQRIRHFGFLGNRYRQAKVELCRELIGDEMAAPVEPVDAIVPCPVCHLGRLVFVGLVRSLEALANACPPPIEDSS